MVFLTEFLLLKIEKYLKRKGMSNQVMTIVGMGPGISKAAAERFAKEGYAIAMIGRNERRLQMFQELFRNQLIMARFATADAADPAELREAFAAIHEALGPTNVLLYNASAWRKKNILEETVDDLVAGFRVSVGGALASVQAVLPGMREAGGGTVLLTGGGLALHPSPELGALAIGKAGLRNLAFSLAAALRPENIKVGTVTVAGFVHPESETHPPTAVADLFWRQHQTPIGELETEVVL